MSAYAMPADFDRWLTTDSAADDSLAYDDWAEQVTEILSKLDTAGRVEFWLRRMNPQAILDCILADEDEILSDYYDRTMLAREFSRSQGRDDPAPTVKDSAYAELFARYNELLEAAKECIREGNVNMRLAEAVEATKGSAA